MLAQLKNRALRERVFKASIARGSHGGKFDNTPEVVKFAETLEKVCVDVVESGRMTKDLAILIRADHPYLTTEAFMDAIDQNEKTLVFCATQDHALAVRNLINQMKNVKHNLALNFKRSELDLTHHLVSSFLAIAGILIICFL